MQVAVVQAGDHGVVGGVDDLGARRARVGVELGDRADRDDRPSPSMSTDPGSKARGAPVAIGRTMPLRTSVVTAPAFPGPGSLSISCGYDLRPSIARATIVVRPGLRICAWSFMRLRPPALDRPCDDCRPSGPPDLRLVFHAATTSGPRSPVRRLSTVRASGSAPRLSCGYDLRPSIARATIVVRPGLRICASVRKFIGPQHGRLAGVDLAFYLRRSVNASDQSFCDLAGRFWHPVARSVDVAPGRVVGARLLDRDLAVFRSADGVVSVLDDGARTAAPG